MNWQQKFAEDLDLKLSGVTNEHCGRQFSESVSSTRRWCQIRCKPFETCTERENTTTAFVHATCYDVINQPEKCGAGDGRLLLSPPAFWATAELTLLATLKQSHTRTRTHRPRSSGFAKEQSARVYSVLQGVCPAKDKSSHAINSNTIFSPHQSNFSVKKTKKATTWTFFWTITQTLGRVTRCFFTLIWSGGERGVARRKGVSRNCCWVIHGSVCGWREIANTDRSTCLKTKLQRKLSASRIKILTYARLAAAASHWRPLPDKQPVNCDGFSTMPAGPVVPEPLFIIWTHRTSYFRNF